MGIETFCPCFLYCPLHKVDDYQKYYLDLIVSPETYRIIDQRNPKFFHSFQVSSNFNQEIVIVPGKEDQEEDTSEEEYSQALIYEWTQKNLYHLPQEEQRIFIDKVEDIMGGR